MNAIDSASLYRQSNGRWTFTIPQRVREQMAKDGLGLGQYMVSYSKEHGLRLNPVSVFTETIKRNAPEMICTLLDIVGVAPA